MIQRPNPNKMEKIGQGLQFTVWGNGNRVIKIPNSKEQVRRKLLRWHPSFLLSPSRLEDMATQVVIDRQRVLEEIKRHSIDLSLLGNVSFSNEGVSQDRLIPLWELLGERGYEIIDSYIHSLIEPWRNGFSEYTYNFTINHGAYSDGTVVIMDIGELTFTREEVVSHIETRRWENSWSYNGGIRSRKGLRGMPRLRRYYKQQMEKNMTLENLDRYWKP